MPPGGSGTIGGVTLQKATLALEAVLLAVADKPRVDAARLRGLRDGLAAAKEALIRERTTAGDELVRRADQAVEATEKLLAGEPPSPTLALLYTTFVDAEFRDRGPIKTGVEQRFMTPTAPAPAPLNGAPARPARSISDQQAEAYGRLRDQVIDAEREYGARDYCVFYHAQDPRMRIAQDVYRKAYEKFHKAAVPDDFHFLRFPTPKNDPFTRWKDATAFLVDKIQETGMIDDNDAGTKLHIISANLTLFGSLAHAGEETFHYFQIGKGQTPLDPTWLIQGFLDGFGYEGSLASAFVRLNDLIDTVEGSLFQILVPTAIVDKIAYLAHPHGIPFDDELLDDIHAIGDIRYQKGPNQDGEAEGPRREKLNDELSRKLKLFPQRPPVDEIVVDPPPLRSAMRQPGAPRRVIAPVELDPATVQAREDTMSRRYRKDLDALTARTIERARAGQYCPSRYLAEYARDPSRFADVRLDATRDHAERAPDHVGHGKVSPHELMRIRNRPLFMQARVLLAKAHMLDPMSGIRIVRHTTVSPRAMAAYERALDGFCDLFIVPKRPLALTYPGFGA